MTAVPLQNLAGTDVSAGTILLIEDVTDRVRLEEHLQISEKMASIGLLAAGQQADVVLYDSQGNELDKRTVTLNEWGGADWTFTLPGNAPLGYYSLQAKVVNVERGVTGSFLVAAYRRPDFRVDVDLAGHPRVAILERRATP